MRVCLLGYHENYFWAGSATLKVQQNVHKYLNLNSVKADLYLCSENKNFFYVLFESLKISNNGDGIIISGGVIPFLVYLTKTKYDVIHMIITRNYMTIIALVTKFLGLQQCVTFHDCLIFPKLPKADFATFKAFFVKWVLAKTTQVICLYNENDLELIRLKLPHKKMVLIKNGVEEKFFELSNSIRAKNIILYAGGANRSYKGFDFLTKAIERVKSDAKLLICGLEETKNPEMNNLGELSPEQFKNVLSEVAILIIPSNYDSFNISALEAMACDTPIIISNRCGVAKHLNDGEGCFIINYGDEVMLAQKIDTLIQDKHLWNKMSAESRVVAQKFLWSKVILDYKNIYLAIVT